MSKTKILIDPSEQAQMLMEQSDWAGAADAWEACIDAHPESPSAGWFIGFAKAHLQLGQQQAAETALKAGAEVLPRAAQIPFMQAKIKFDAQDWNSARILAARARDIARAEKKWALFGQARIFTAKCQAQNGNVAQALSSVLKLRHKFTPPDKKFRDKYIDFLCDIRASDQLIADYNDGYLSDGYSPKDGRAVFLFIQCNEIDHARNLFEAAYENRVEEEDFQRLISNISVLYSSTERATWLERVYDDATARFGSGAQNDVELLKARLHALYGLENTDAFGELSKELDHLSPTDSAPYLRAHAALSLPKEDARAQQKIFGIGLSKTGTTSLSHALNTLGFSTADFINPFSQQLICERDLYAFDALTDTPVSYQFEKLHATFPNAKFIYTERTLDSWMASFTTYFKTSLNLAEFGELEHIINGTKEIKHGALFKEIFNNLYVPFQSAEDAYMTYESRVFSHFGTASKDSFLRFNMFAGDGYQKLAEFLNVEAPDMPFPHSNASKTASEGVSSLDTF